MKKVLFAILIIIGLVIIGGYWYLNNSKPHYNGTIAISGIEAEVNVNFDNYGIPHIYAQTAEDAYFALGYLQAQERLFQMEMIRRVATGRLSEILGEEFIETDKLFRVLSIAQKSEEFYEDFKKGAGPYKTAAEAYFKGINSFINNGPTPIEFSVIGIPKAPFSVKDAYGAAGYMSFGFADGFRVDPLTSKIALTLGEDYLKDIGLHTIYDSTYIRSYISDESLSLTALSSTINKIPAPLLHGSNSWVISPKKSATGNAIFENDTHIQFGQPSVWYEAHLEYPGTAIYGHYLAGFPFAILGHNQFAAWGMTMFENDDVDLYQEKLNPDNRNEIWRKTAWQQLESREEVIKVKDGNPIKFTVRSSDHGPIINDVLFSDSIVQEPVSTYWEFLHAKNDLLKPTYKLGNVSHIDQARQAASEIESPGLNIMYADKDGNIAWWAAARLPIRPEGSNPKLLLDGSSGKDDYLGYYDFTANPQAENPPWGYVYSANNQPDSVNGILYPGYYRPLDRASRIVDHLDGKDDWTIDDVKELTSDVKSPIAVLVAKTMTNVLIYSDDTEIVRLGKVLSEWNGDHQLVDPEPTIYYTLLSWTLYHAMADELGYEDYQTLANLEVMKRSYLMFIANDSSVWWNNITTSSQESRKEIIETAAQSTIATLTNIFDSNDIANWEWSKVHTVTHAHPLGQIGALEQYFNVGPYPATGGNEVINNMMFKLDTTGYFPVVAGPSMRTVIDMANINSAESINPTGQSGHFLSPHYDDQAKMFLNVEFRGQLMDSLEISEAASNHLTFIPMK